MAAVSLDHIRNQADAILATPSSVTADTIDEFSQNLFTSLQHSEAQPPLVVEPLTRSSPLYELCLKVVRVLKKTGLSALAAPLEKRAFQLKMGSHISVDAISDEAYQFYKKNYLQAILFTLGVRVEATLSGEPKIPYVNQQGITVWKSLSEFTRIMSEGIITFYDDGEIAFKTKRDLTLCDDYSINYQGILHHDKYHSPTLLPLCPRQENDGQAPFILEVLVSTTKKQGEDFGGWTGSHTYIQMKDPQHIYSFGKYGPFDQMGCQEYSCLAGKMEGRISSPDEYSTLPNENRNVYKKQFVLTEEQFHGIQQHLVNQRNLAEFHFNVLNNNCTTLATSILQRFLGIECESTLPIALYLPIFLIPPKVRAPFQRFFRWYQSVTPKILKKGFSLATIPLYYPYSVLCGLFIFIISRYNPKKIPGRSFSLMDIFFLRCGMDHPVTFREGLKKLRL